MQAVPSVQPSIADLAASPADLEGAIGRATEAILALQREDGHWVFELEADATIPAEYVLLKHFLGEPADLELEAKIANYLRRIQGAHGGWPLFHEGAFNISASVKAYFALKMIGDSTEAPHMVRAREAILAHGGAATCNVFTRAMLALFAQIPWRGVPVMPVEIMLLPRWFPFHLDKISYWARTVLVPLLVLMALKPRARNPRGIGIAELFVVAPARVRNWPKGPHQVQPWSAIFGAVDRLLRRIEPLFPGKSRRRAIDRAAEFVIERLNGEDGLGAIFPAMANTVMMFEILGYPHDDPRVVLARRSIEKLVVVKEDEAYCHLFDTALKRPPRSGVSTGWKPLQGWRPWGLGRTIAAGRPFNMPIRTSHLDDRRGGHGHGQGGGEGRRGLPAMRAGANGSRAAEPQRLGRLRCRHKITTP
jgi:squalene-hopene/tetraprenyl-beta-curcumene cyclase